MKKSKKKVFILLLFIVGLILIFSAIFIFKNDSDFNAIVVEYKDLYEKGNIPKENTDLSDVDKVKNHVNKFYGHDKEKEKILKELEQLEKYLKFKDEINSYFEDENVIRSTITDEEIAMLTEEKNKLNKDYQKLVEDNIQNINTQYNNIKSIEEKINNLYENNQLKQGITHEIINSYIDELNKIPQKNIIEKNKILLDEANNTINARLEEQRRIAEQRRREEEQRRKAEEERKQAINAAWVKLSVPYISQNKNNVLNGCEAASLLMGLKFKGYLKDMSLPKYAELMPKSKNPQEGFTYDIYGVEPKDIPHWIAPGALAEFGRNSSGNQNVVNGTGLTLEQLDRELDNGNPVVIYLTAMFKTPKTWVEGAPQNIHVQLLTGYNKITGQHIITDPWTYNDGRTKWTIEKNVIENLYNALGKQSVIIR